MLLLLLLLKFREPRLIVGSRCRPQRFILFAGASRSLHHPSAAVMVGGAVPTLGSGIAGHAPLTAAAAAATTTPRACWRPLQLLMMMLLLPLPDGGLQHRHHRRPRLHFVFLLARLRSVVAASALHDTRTRTRTTRHSVSH
jgi:hypothetical protein